MAMNGAPNGFELSDHTADLGVRVWAPTMAELVAPAAEGLYAAMGELVPGGEVAPFQFSAESSGTANASSAVHAGDPAVLLRDFLTELVHEFEIHGRIVRNICATEFTDRRLTVEGRLHGLDREKSEFGSEVKAVTYHELAIRRTDAGFEATFILDI